MKSIYDLDVPNNRKGISGWKLKNSVPLTSQELALELEKQMTLSMPKGRA